ADRELYRDHPDIDLEVIQNGFGFLAAMIPNATSTEDEKVKQYVTELFELEMRSLPRPTADDPYCEIRETPHLYDRWIMQRVAEWISHTNSVEIARRLYRPILDLGAAGRYWVEDFLQAWITNALVMSKDLNGFANIWRDMVEYTMGLSIWRPDPRLSWTRTDSLAADLMGLREQAGAILGKTEYRSLIGAMAEAFDQWARVWLRYALDAGWFAHFLRTDSGQVLLPQGIKQLAIVIASFE